MASFKILIALFSVLVLALHLVEPHPISRKPKSKRASFGNFGFPQTVNVVTERPSNSCFVVVTKQYTQQEQVVNYDGSTSTIEKVVNVTTRECCPKYTGTECNQLVDPYELSNPCRGLTCSNHPNAICAVVSKCGRNVPLFIDAETSNKVNCGNEDGSIPDITSLSCSGTCTSDPCKGQTCQANPSAMCLVQGCDCTPKWYLQTGERIDCTTGESIPRNKRQISDAQSTTCRK